jgi:hypothetical protein
MLLSRNNHGKTTKDLFANPWPFEPSVSMAIYIIPGLSSRAENREIGEK